MKRIAVIFGGKSQEHDVSVITGVLTLNSLDKTLFDAVPVYVGKDGVWRTGEGINKISAFTDGEPKGLKRVALLPGDDNLYYCDGKLKKFFKPYCAIVCTHGKNGEDGTIAALLKLCGIPFASPDVLPAALSMDKEATKLSVGALGIKTVEGFVVSRSEYYESPLTVQSKTDKFGYPVVVKPSSSGSSIGVSVVKSEKQLKRAFDEAFRFDVKVVVERFLEGAYDINCAAYGDGKRIYVSECEKPSGGEFLSFNDKYLGSKGGSKRVFPFNEDEKAVKEIKLATEKIYERLGFSGIIRVDYLLKDGAVYMNEINSVPGSMAYYLFCEKLGDFTALLTKLIERANAVWREYSNCETTFSSSVLKLDGVNIKK